MMESSSEKPPIASPGILSDADTSLVAEGSKRDRAVSIEEPRPPKTTSQSAVPSIKPTSTRASSVPNPARPDETPLRHTSSLRSRMSNRDAPAQNSTSRAMTMVSMGLVKKEAPKWKEPTVRQGIRAIIFASPLNFLVIFVPISWALHFALDKSKSSSDTVIFVTCFLAIIPLAKLLAWGTEEIAMRVGQTLGGLLNATFGNVVELIVGVIALAQCKLNVVQSSLVGSILSNLLLVLGMCFFAGGTRFSEQGFMQTAAQLNTSLLILSVTAILIPAAFHVAVQNDASSTDNADGPDILKMSHGVAIILLVIYGASLVFQLFSHAHLYDDAGAGGAMKSTLYPPADPNSKTSRMKRRLHIGRKKQDGTSESGSDRSLSPNAASVGTSTARANGHHEDGDAIALETLEEEGSQQDVESQPHSGEEEEEEEEESPQLTAWTAVGLLVVVTVLVAVTAEFLVSSIDGLTATGHISETWVGLILLPIVGNAAEHVTAVTVSVKDKLDLSIGVAVGSSIQIALFVIPLLVLLGWIMGKPLTLLFDPFQSIVLFLAVLTVAFCINDGRSNWLEGLILMSLYVLLGTAFWFYPSTSDGSC